MSGFDSYIVKPFKLEDIIHTYSELLRKKIFNRINSHTFDKNELEM